VRAEENPPQCITVVFSGLTFFHSPMNSLGWAVKKTQISIIFASSVGDR
jgi:hypothetical protein